MKREHLNGLCRSLQITGFQDLTCSKRNKNEDQRQAYGDHVQRSFPECTTFFSKGCEKVEGVGVMNDKELKLEEIEASRTLGGERGKVMSRGEGK